MATDEELRARIIEAAADLFAQYGFSGTKVNMVAKAARVSSQTVRRLTGGRADLFEQVMMARVSSSVAEKFATAVENPEGRPAIAVMLAAAQEVFTSPEASWGLLELEALTRAHTDDTLHEIEKGRIDRRRENAAALVARIRANGGLDADLSDTAIVHLVLAMSLGLAMLDPVLDVKPTMANWIMLIARIGTAMAPQDMLLSPAFDAGQPWRLRVDVPDQPGGVARLVRALGSLHAYTVAMQVVDASEGYRTIDVALIAPEGVTPEVMRAMAHSVGKHAYVGPGSLDDAIDLPTRVLDGATQLVTTPELAPFAAAKLVEADNVEVAAATEGRTTALTSCGCSGPRTATSCCSAAGRRSRALSAPGPPRCCVCRPRSPRRPATMRRPRGLSPSKVGPSGFGWPVLRMPMRSPRCTTGVRSAADTSGTSRSRTGAAPVCTGSPAVTVVSRWW